MSDGAPPFWAVHIPRGDQGPSRAVLTKQQELAAVPIELPQADAELMDGGPIAVFMEQCCKLLDLLR